MYDVSSCCKTQTKTVSFQELDERVLRPSVRTSVLSFVLPSDCSFSLASVSLCWHRLCNSLAEDGGEGGRSHDYDVGLAAAKASARKEDVSHVLSLVRIFSTVSLIRRCRGKLCWRWQRDRHLKKEDDREKQARKKMIGRAITTSRT